MSDHSKREQLLVKVESMLNELTCIKTVLRRPVTDIEELESFSSAQLPMMVILGQLPVPDEKMSSRRPNIDLSTSVLGVVVTAYMLDNETPDTTISSVADDFWAKMLVDSTLGYKWVLSVTIKFVEDAGILPPYAMFSAIISITYHHDKGGI